jgi:hypothetical protein
VKRSAPDVVWATGLKAAFMSVPACRLSRVPLVWHKIDFSLDAIIALPLAAAVDGVVSVSEAVADALGPLRARRLVSVVGPPVRLAQELQLAPNERVPTIGTVATLTPIKGQLHIIEAAAILSAEFPDLRVLLAGGPSVDYPSYADELRRTAEQLEIAERVEITGFVSDVTQVLAQLTVFINATCRDERGFGWEGLSGAMLEEAHQRACATGSPGRSWKVRVRPSSPARRHDICASRAWPSRPAKRDGASPASSSRRRWAPRDCSTPSPRWQAGVERDRRVAAQLAPPGRRRRTILMAKETSSGLTILSTAVSTAP